MTAAAPRLSPQGGSKARTSELSGSSARCGRLPVATDTSRAVGAKDINTSGPSPGRNTLQGNATACVFVAAKAPGFAGRVRHERCLYLAPHSAAVTGCSIKVSTAGSQHRSFGRVATRVMPRRYCASRSFLGSWADLTGLPPRGGASGSNPATCSGQPTATANNKTLVEVAQ